MMLCAKSFVFNSLGDVFGLMSCKRGAKNGQLFVGFHSTEDFGRLQHAGGVPAGVARIFALAKSGIGI